MIAMVLLPVVVAMGLGPDATAIAVRPVRLVSDVGSRSSARMLEERLTKRGAHVATADEIPWLNVHVSSESSGFRLLLKDGEGRRAERLVSNADIATVMIESWLRTDILDPVLGPLSPEPPPPLPQAKSTESAAVVAVAVPPEAARRSPFALAASSETSLSSDRSLWLGGSATVRSVVGAYWIDLTLRVASATALAAAPVPLYKGESKGQMTRLASDAIIGLARPFWLGRVVVVPRLGVGLGGYRAVARYEEHVGRVFVMGPRLEPGVILSWRLRDAWWAELTVTATLSTPVRGSTYADSNFDIPREPSMLGHMALGLRYGTL